MRPFERSKRRGSLSHSAGGRALCQPSAQVAITDCSPLWLQTCPRHVCLTRRALSQRELKRPLTPPGFSQVVGRRHPGMPPCDCLLPGRKKHSPRVCGGCAVFADCQERRFASFAQQIRAKRFFCGMRFATAREIPSPGGFAAARRQKSGSAPRPPSISEGRAFSVSDPGTRSADTPT